MSSNKVSLLRLLDYTLHSYVFLMTNLMLDSLATEERSGQLGSGKL